MKNPLETFFFPMSRKKFLDHYRTNTPVVAHGRTKQIAELVELPFLKSLDSLLPIWPSYVNAYLPGISDEANSTKVEPDQAKHLFQEGRGLYFDDPNKFSPLIREWLEAIKEDLGLSTLTYSRSLIYAIANKRGTSPHFDQNINFILQISGTKKWKVAPNKHVENPMDRHTMGLDVEPELARYIQRPMPETFPEDAVEFVLEPGSILFLPRGSWHTTEAMTDALSLNFTYSPPTWIDLFTSAIRDRLVQSSKWRATADFVTDEQLHTQAIEIFDRLLSDISGEIPHWTARDILSATERDKLPS